VGCDYEPVEDWPTTRIVPYTTEIKQLESRKSVLIKYIEVKLAEEDWHGVSDACNDIREIEAKLEVLK
jgi:hypothetical protein